MKHLNVAAASLNLTPLAWKANGEVIVRAIERARGEGAHVVCLPELCITGYGCEDLFLSDWIYPRALEMLWSLLPSSRGMVVTFGLPLLVDGARYNAVAVAGDGEILGFTLKKVLASRDVYYESRWFSPWPSGQSSSLMIETPVGSRRYPVGDLLFDVDDIRIAFEICEEAWVSERPAQSLADDEVDLILNPSASHFAFLKHARRVELCEVGSTWAKLGYVYSNLLGCESGRLIFDGDCIVARNGAVIAESKMLSLREFQVLSTALPIPADRRRPRPASNQRTVVVASGILSERAPAHPSFDARPAPWQVSADRKNEEFVRAVALGLFDYLRKSRSHGFVVSLSGGIDSTAVSTLAAMMVHLALAEIGWEEFRARLSYLTELAPIKPSEIHQIVGQLLTCVSQSTRNNSGATRTAARAFAREIGATFYEFEIDHLVDTYTHKIGDAIGRPLTWEHDDIALQNVQSRVRSPSVWLLANLRGALLLSTSNRSEAAVGYATMDGDTSGGLAPIAGIDKAALREWMRWMSHTGPKEVGPLASLAAVLGHPPGPELRPLEAGQTGEGDLMPYELLDAIERAAIRDRLAPAAVRDLMSARYSSEFPPSQLTRWVIRFFRLWSRNQWKRERYAPSFHLDDENLDPKTWCRFPILSGGFEEDLLALEDELTRTTKECS